MKHNRYYFGKSDLKTFNDGNDKEWYLPNGLGGYSSGTVINSSNRKQNGYLIASLNPPVQRMLILAKTTEEVTIEGQKINLASDRLVDKTQLGYQYLESFQYQYLPTYQYFVLGVQIIKKVSPHYLHNTVAITYEINSPIDCEISVTPYFSYTEHGEVLTPKQEFKSEVKGKKLLVNPALGLPITFKTSTGRYRKKSSIKSSPIVFSYDLNTGDDRTDAYYTPYEIVINCQKDTKQVVEMICTIEELPNLSASKIIKEMEKRHKMLLKRAKIKDDLGQDLVIATDAFICERASTGLKTILAGLPWFTDWGRDTMIAFTGCTLVPARYQEAKEILSSFAKYEHNGLIPNMFPDNNTEPLYNTVDASLWYFYAIKKYDEYLKNDGLNDDEYLKKELLPVLKKIIEAYEKGTDFSIKMDKDGLIQAGSNLDQITWMDVRINGICVTPRHGKPVEINALWYNALLIISEFLERFGEDSSHYRKIASLVKENFQKKFYCPKTKALYDVIDENDEAIRPNQIWVLSLPYKLLDEDIAKEVFDTVTKELYNTYGLRSLAPSDPEFKPLYEGALLQRDFAYHMGTTWGFLIGGYLDAYAYINRDKENCQEKIREMVEKFIPHLRDGAINGVAEIFDGAYAYRTRGCATQAWSVAELLRAYYENCLKEVK